MAGRACSYSLSMPMGRPKRGRSRLGSNNAIQSPVATEPRAAGDNPVSPPHSEHILENVSSLDVASHLSGFEQFRRFHALSLTFSMLGQPEADPCACLSILYLLLERIRTTTRPFAAPGNMLLLRECIGSAREVLICPHCPQGYLSSIQNVSILGTLCLCIAESYSRILRSIDEEEQRASRANEQKQLEITSSGFAPTQNNNSNGTPTLFQWKAVMRNTVKAEIFGVDGYRERCFLSFIADLEERQKRWHENPSVPDFNESGRLDGADEHIPLCLAIIKEARRMLNDLGL
ncbi:hypothetical protein ASPVEDRAFT_23958 [Aspergillus versicolor CBS 583.65]|uniref:C6 finger domain protein n=1 Tax=Aspergillus versicolor CBS 583.65 TaxID=1036611 RepID=A0A1L9P627_ASPVE|nr:uncharacterized protein ASPVEDRAFT_23958 [Aspergillus versicolor CBS 583.65]OJI96980.1 hypothetical protein ASPVEDRAFT_23958 [Aspergillus versicolor CBS 583.65]